MADHHLDRLKKLACDFETIFYCVNFFTEQLESFKLFLTEIFNIQNFLSLSIEEWKREQQRSIIHGSLNHSNLKIFIDCNNIILSIYDQCLEYCKRNNIDDEYLDRILDQAILLFQTSFIVSEQPCSSILRHDPLTIISNAKFELKLNFLFDEKYIVAMVGSAMAIDLRLLTEEELIMVAEEGLKPVLQTQSSFKIIDKSEPVLYIDSNSIPSISKVCSLQVDMNRRGHNPKAVPVVEKKFKFVFWFEGKIRNRSFICHTFSLPVNVLSRKDYPNSYATIIWDNAFPVEGRKLFETRSMVEWKELAQVLNWKFKKDVGIDLIDEHLNFIYTMIPQRNELDFVTWEHFAKIPLPMRQFTFFEWFYRTLVLVREQLIDYYRDGLIHGFISSNDSEKLLQGCPDGTFLLRFSVTFCGAITMVFVRNRKILKLFPWDLDQLKKISLSKTIKCSEFLLYLYPNIPKDDVFAKFYVSNSTIKSITGKDYNNTDYQTFLS